MATKKPPKNLPDAHLLIDQTSPTWFQVKTYCVRVIATASAVLEDPGASMVDIRNAQGDKRTAMGLLRLANPEQRPIDADVPEFYPSGGPD